MVEADDRTDHNLEEAMMDDSLSNAIKAWYAHTDKCVVCHLALANCADTDDASCSCDRGVELAQKALFQYLIDR